MAAAQRRLIEARSALARLDYRVRKGALLPAREVQDAAFRCGRLARDPVLAFPPRVAAVVAGPGDDASGVAARPSP